MMGGTCTSHSTAQNAAIPGSADRLGTMYSSGAGGATQWSCLKSRHRSSTGGATRWSCLKSRPCSYIVMSTTFTSLIAPYTIIAIQEPTLMNRMVMPREPTLQLHCNLMNILLQLHFTSLQHSKNRSMHVTRN